VMIGLLAAYVTARRLAFAPTYSLGRTTDDRCETQGSSAE
jgi:hypothetical protein